MTMAQSEKAADGTTQPQQPVSMKNVTLSSFKLKVFGCIAVAVVFFLSMASAKATNPCSETQHWIEYANGSTFCLDCSPCYPGQGLTIECGKRIAFDAKVDCLPCPQGVSYSSKHDTSSCTACSSCAEDQVVLQNCSSDSDVKCAKRCHGRDRYYNDDKGECLACSKCCGDEHDVEEDECKEKLGVGSNMICSFDSSFNRCDKSTAHPHKPTTAANKGTGAVNHTYTNPSQSSDALPMGPTVQGTKDQRKEQDLLSAVGIPVVILSLLVGAGCFYFYKTRQVNTSIWCNGDAERGNPDSELDTRVRYSSLDEKTLEDGAQEQFAKINKSYSLETRSPESSEPLLKKVNPEILTCSCEVDTKEDGAEEKLTKRDIPETAVSLESPETLPKVTIPGDPGIVTCSCVMDTTKKDSKLLSSLLENESHMQKICECLDTPTPGVGHYRAVALYYGSNHYQIVSVFEKQCGGPSRAIMEWLAADKPEITVSEFVAVAREEAKRNDVAKLLEAYDLEQNS